MKRALHIIAWGLVIILHGWFLLDSFGYYQKSPTDLIYVGAITAVCSGAIAFYYTRSLRGQRRILIALHGLLTVCSASFATWLIVSAIHIFSAPSFPSFSALPSTQRGQVALVGAFLVAIVIGLGLMSFHYGNLFFQSLKDSYVEH
jgi:hypothetical protein